MKTNSPNLHGRKLVISLQEQTTLELDTRYYLSKGYPKHIASQYAYDHLMAARRGMQ